MPLLLGGVTIEDVGDRFDGDNLGEDPTTAWSLAITAARNAWLAPGATERTVHLSFGDTPATEYGWQMTTDLAVHAWDLARGIGADDDLPADLCEAVLDFVGPQADSWRESGVFAAAVPVPATPTPRPRCSDCWAASDDAGRSDAPTLSDTRFLDSPTGRNAMTRVVVTGGSGKLGRAVGGRSGRQRV